jgi:Na+/melibiose symporter-like transporter
MTILAYQVFLRERPDGSGGVLARDGYLNYAAVCTLLIFVAILVSTAATHRFIPWLRQAPIRPITAVGQTREIFATLKNHAFFVATLSGMFTAIAGSCKSFLDLFFNLYFWGFTQTQLSILTVASLVAGVGGVLGAPFLGRWLGKKRAAITAYLIALGVGVTPLLGRLMGLLPQNGDPLLFQLILVEVLINIFFASMTGIMLVSMIADVVEDAEVKTGRRSEGLLFSADNLFKKITSAGGPMMGAAMLTAVSFPRGVGRHDVPQETLYNLALIYLPTVGTLYFLAILCLFMFRLDKAKHEDNLRILAEGAAIYDAEQSPQPAAGPV